MFDVHAYLQVATARDDPLKVTDPEIFDDNDFYHHILQEFIQHKNSYDPVILTKLVRCYLHRLIALLYNLLVTVEILFQSVCLFLYLTINACRFLLRYVDSGWKYNSIGKGQRKLLIEKPAKAERLGKCFY